MSKEILVVVEVVFNEKVVFCECIFEVLEIVLVILIKKKYEIEIDVCVVIDCKIGVFEMFCCWLVVENVEYLIKEILFEVVSFDDDLV